MIEILISLALLLILDLAAVRWGRIAGSRQGTARTGSADNHGNHYDALISRISAS